MIGEAELREAWRIFTPLLDEIDGRRPQPVVYPFHALVPAGVLELARANGVVFSPAALRSFATEPELSSALGKAVAELAAAAADAGGPFRVALSGGSLVGLLAAGLLALDGVDYSNWHVFFADERVVPLDSDESNYQANREALFSKVAGLATERIYTIDASMSAQQAADAYNEQLIRVFGTGAEESQAATAAPEFDLILLGMGADGHTASLFPDHPVLDMKERWIAPVEDSPTPPHSRITFTYPLINAAKAVFFVCTGAAKAKPLAVALGAAKGSVPAQRVRPGGGKLEWYVDDMASKIYREQQSTSRTQNKQMMPYM